LPLIAFYQSIFLDEVRLRAPLVAPQRTIENEKDSLRFCFAHAHRLNPNAYKIEGIQTKENSAMIRDILKEI
jgi:hypothetical protein